MQHSNALMATSSLDRISGGLFTSTIGVGTPNTSTITTQPYTSFKVQAQGGNIIQGQINKIRVAELMMPYSIPTVMDFTTTGVGPGGVVSGVQSNASLFLQVYSVPTGATATTTLAVQLLKVPSGFYTGTELAAVIQTAINAAQVTLGVPAGTFICAYDSTTASIVLRNDSVFSAVPATVNYMGTFLLVVPAAVPAYGSPNLLWTIGLRDIYARYPAVLPTQPAGSTGGIYTNPSPPMLVPSGYPNVGPYPIFATGYAVSIINASAYTGVYTQYIDICSPSLCQAQYVRDGNTNQQIIRRDIIARVYIASEVSAQTVDPAGTRPFTIHRQFKNPKIMKWTAERSIDSIDLSLYDQYGQIIPLIPPTLAPASNPNSIPKAGILQGQPADFAITFLVDEHDETKEHNNGYTM